MSSTTAPRHPAPPAEELLLAALLLIALALELVIRELVPVAALLLTITGWGSATARPKTRFRPGRKILRTSCAR